MDGGVMKASLRRRAKQQIRSRRCVSCNKQALVIEKFVDPLPVRCVFCGWHGAVKA